MTIEKYHLSEENVHNVFMDCLFDEEESKDNYIAAQGVRLNIGFNPERVKKNEAKISDMLNQLPATFKQDSGGGWSFLNACINDTGVQWANDHQFMDELLCLGTAIGKAEILLPRDLWHTLPGGVPYFVIKN